MSTIVDATIPAEQFALHEALETVSSAEFEVLPVIAHGTDRLMPYIWASGADFEEIDRALADDPSVENVEALTVLDDEYLYKMEWRAHIRIVIYMLVEENASILWLCGKNDRWHVRVLFPEHDSVSSTYDFCEEYGIKLSVRSVQELSDSTSRGLFSLTRKQHDALTEALRSDYYEVPRGTTLEELSDAMDVSHQALSERLRRGHKQLVLNALRVDGDEQASD